MMILAVPGQSSRHLDLGSRRTPSCAERRRQTGRTAPTCPDPVGLGRRMRLVRFDRTLDAGPRREGLVAATASWWMASSASPTARGLPCSARDAAAEAARGAVAER